MMYKSKGFTLIEIAIVLVIIGLLLGGVLKGQELITGARVRNLISQQDGIKAAFFGFQDRFRALPGDYAAARPTSIRRQPTTTATATGASRTTPTGGPPVTHEEILAWNHLTAAGFLNGSYTYHQRGHANPGRQHSEQPLQRLRPADLRQRLWHRHGLHRPKKHNLKTGGQVPVEIIAEVDRKIDDGKPNSGGFQFSEYAPTGIQRARSHVLRQRHQRMPGTSAEATPTAAAPACSKPPTLPSGRAARSGRFTVSGIEPT